MSYYLIPNTHKCIPTRLWVEDRVILTSKILLATALLKGVCPLHAAA